MQKEFNLLCFVLLYFEYQIIREVAFFRLVDRIIVFFVFNFRLRFFENYRNYKRVVIFD